MVREALRVSLPLFWTRPSTKYFYKINQNSSFRVASPEHTNYNLLGRHVVDRPYNRRSVNGQRHSNLPSSTTRVCTEFKEVSVDTYTESRFLRGDSGFIDHDSVSTGEESLKSSEVLSGTSSENTSVDFRTTKLTIQAVLPAQMNFQYLQQQQMLALKTQRSYCKKETQGRTAVVDKKLKNLQWSLLDSVSQSNTDTDRSSRKGWGALCQRISTGGQWSKEEQLLHINVLKLKAVKLAIFTFNKQKSLKTIHFQIDNPTALLYLVKMGAGGTGNQMLLKLSKEIWQYLL